MSSIKLSKDEGIMCFTALENVVIKGKDASKLVPLLDKLDKHITKELKKEGQTANFEKVTAMASK
tara:strand:+ start:6873 stop:7067 length:195 start_codon:yes stop_codon:yes gene_type:complete